MRSLLSGPPQRVCGAVGREAQHLIYTTFSLYFARSHPLQFVGMGRLFLNCCPRGSRWPHQDVYCQCSGVVIRVAYDHNRLIMYLGFVHECDAHSPSCERPDQLQERLCIQLLVVDINGKIAVFGI